MVQVNGLAAKSSKEVKIGDHVTIYRRNRITEVEVASIPAGKQVAKSAAATLYRLLKDEAATADPLA